MVVFQVKNLARELYDCHFKAAESHPRDIVAKLHSIVQHIEQACEMHSDLSKVGHKHHENYLIYFHTLLPIYFW